MPLVPETERTQQILRDAALALSAFWDCPEADILRGAESHVLVLADQQDPRNHVIMRRLGAEPNMDPDWSRWTTLVLPKSDFAPHVREAVETRRSPDRYPLLVLADGGVSLTTVADPRARRAN